MHKNKIQHAKKNTRVYISVYLYVEKYRFMHVERFAKNIYIINYCSAVGAFILNGKVIMQFFIRTKIYKIMEQQNMTYVKTDYYRHDYV